MEKKIIAYGLNNVYEIDGKAYYEDAVSGKMVRAPERDDLIVKPLGKGDRVMLDPNIEGELDPGRYRGLTGTIVRADEHYGNQYWIKMDERAISKGGKLVPGITTIFHADNLIKENETGKFCKAVNGKEVCFDKKGAF